MLDDIETAMTAVRDDEDSELPNVICVAAQATLLLIEKYFSLINDCELYLIAIVCKSTSFSCLTYTLY
jgi:hypothetical protein